MFSSHHGAKLSRLALLTLAGALTIILLTVSNVQVSQAQEGGAQTVNAAPDSVQPQLARPDDVYTSPLSRRQQARLKNRLSQMREAVAAKYDVPEGPPGLPEEAVPESQAVSGAEAAGDLVIARNVIPNPTLSSPQYKDTTGEPAVVNMGRRAFYTGNDFAAYSSNDGTSWTMRAFPPSPTAGESFCCDNDLEIDQGRNRVFWVLLYLNGTGTHGTLRIAVMTAPDAAPSCYYDFNFGANRVPDYPHLGLSNDFLWFSINQINTQGTASTADDTWVNSQMRRYNLDNMSDCVNASGAFYTYGPPTYTSQRVFVPVEGAEDSMYWGVLHNTTTFRIFEWPESSNTITNWTRTITTSPHNNPDCRGGTNNKDFIEKGTAYKITGFRMRGWYGRPPKGGAKDVVGFLWNVGTDSSHTQGHIHGAVFDADTKNLSSQPHIYDNSYCFGFPDVAPTERGHPAIILAYGGKKGGGGNAVRNAVFLGDDRAIGGGPFGIGTNVATGTHNPPDARYGDYLTIQQHEPCDLFMSAAGYVLNGGTSSSNVEFHYVQFGRGRDESCWNLWHGEP